MTKEAVGKFRITRLGVYAKDSKTGLPKQLEVGTIVALPVEEDGSPKSAVYATHVEKVVDVRSAESITTGGVDPGQGPSVPTLKNEVPQG